MIACLFEDSREGQASVCEVEPRGNYLGFLQAHVLGTADCLVVKRVPLLSNILQPDFFLLISEEKVDFQRSPAITTTTVGGCASLRH